MASTTDSDTLGAGPVTPQRDLVWRKSSLSMGNGNSVEVADLGGGWTGIRDSKDPDGAVLRFDPGEWQAFIGGARLGDFDGYGRPEAVKSA